VLAGVVAGASLVVSAASVVGGVVPAGSLVGAVVAPSCDVPAASSPQPASATAASVMRTVRDVCIVTPPRVDAGDRTDEASSTHRGHHEPEGRKECGCPG
jgi:hypothetical protein